MQELGKFNLEINDVPNGLEKYMNITINKLIFIDRFQFLSSSLNCLNSLMFGISLRAVGLNWNAMLKMTKLTYSRSCHAYIF